MGLTTNEANRLLSYSLIGRQLHVGLYTGEISKGGIGPEVTGASYLRPIITFAVEGDIGNNDKDVNFPVATEDWGTITHVAVRTSVGQTIWFGELPAPVTIFTNDQFLIAAGELKATLV